VALVAVVAAAAAAAAAATGREICFGYWWTLRKCTFNADHLAAAAVAAALKQQLQHAQACMFIGV
jgi:hypothetical protein